MSLKDGGIYHHSKQHGHREVMDWIVKENLCRCKGLYHHDF